MNMMLLTGLSVALALSIITMNNFYANKVTITSIKDGHRQIEATMSNVFKGESNCFSWNCSTNSGSGNSSNSKWSNVGPN
jgi:hypothetical protein